VRRLLHSIHDEVFQGALTVKQLKKRCGIGDHNVSCRFKHEVGVSIKGYIESLRLDAAAYLLARGHFTASEAAQSVGYANLQTFYPAFRRRFGCTPGEYRARMARGATEDSEAAYIRADVRP
jgi:AraC-like DNA-binding protein